MDYFFLIFNVHTDKIQKKIVIRLPVSDSDFTIYKTFLYFIKNIYIILFSLSYKYGYQKSYSGKENANVKCQHRSKKRKFIFEDNIHVWLNTVTKVLTDNSSFFTRFFIIDEKLWHANPKIMDCRCYSWAEVS